MTTPDPRLRRVLEDRSHDVHVVGGLAERAIARERSNRRRELTTAVAVGALALAVAVPVGWNAMRSEVPRQAPASTSGVTLPSSAASTPTTSPSPQPRATPTIQATGAPDAARLVPAKGAPTATTDLGYVTDGVYIEGSTRITLPPGLQDPQWVARLGDGVLAVPARGGDYVVVDAQGRRGDSIMTISGAVIGDNRSHVAAVDRNEDLVYYDSSGAEIARLTAEQCECSTEESHGSWEPVGIVGPLVYANRSHDQGHVIWNTATGEVARAEGTIALFHEAGLLALMSDLDDAAGDGDRICSELVDLDTGTTRWRLCGPIHFTGFSPEGDYLIGTGAIDGIDPHRTTGKLDPLVVLRTEDARFVLRGGGDGTDPTTDGVHSARMGRDHSLTVVTSSSDGVALQRCALDGSCAVVTDPRVPLEVDGEPVAPYLLSAN